MQSKIITFNSDYVLGWVSTKDAVKKVVVTINNKKINADLIKKNNRVSFFAKFNFEKSGIKEAYLEIFSDSKVLRRSKVKKLPFLNEVITVKTIYSPFPKDVTNILMSLDDKYLVKNYWSDELISSAIDDIFNIAKNGGADIASKIHKYLLFLKTMRMKFEFIEATFPKLNKLSNSIEEKDSRNILTTSMEMLLIANYLYVLKSYNVKGDFLEFGCFKGFSTSCLSWACLELGIKLVVFDSFKGLPSTVSNYYKKGDFNAPFDEVYENIKNYGFLKNVEFIKGYFFETIDKYQGKPICMWLDVDLASSAKDAMRHAKKLPENVGVFSNEVSKDHFASGKLRVKKVENEPVSEIVSFYEKENKKLSGYYLYEDTGFFYEDNRSIRALKPKDLIDIMSKL